MTARSKRNFILWGFASLVLSGALLYLAGPWFTYFWRAWVGEHLQMSVSPDGIHTAELRRTVGWIDFNYVVNIDGKKVYTSPDLCGEGYRETLVWDTSGEKFLLLLKSRRVFAYDAQKGEALGKGQLNDFDFQPESDLPELICGNVKDIQD